MIVTIFVYIVGNFFSYVWIVSLLSANKMGIVMLPQYVLEFTCLVIVICQQVLNGIRRDLEITNSIYTFMQDLDFLTPKKILSAARLSIVS